MKNKLFAILAAFGMVASASAVKINNNLSINGFLDGSYRLEDTKGADEQGLQSDEAELNFVLTNGAVSGVLNIDSHEIGGGTDGSNKADLDIEQAHFTYDLGNGVSVTFGRYGSLLGFEREDPAGLYTYSRAYTGSRTNLGDVDSNANEGLRINYAADQFNISASFENARDVDLESDDLNLEVAFSYTGIADTVIGGGYLFDNRAASDAANEENVLNIHGSRSFGKLLVAAEYSEFQKDAGDRDAFLILVDYDYTDKIGVALRFSNEEQAGGQDYEKLTIAPNYAITENLGAILEFSDIEDKAQANPDSTVVAVELTYTF